MDIEDLLSSISEEDMVKIKGIAESIMSNSDENTPKHNEPKQEALSNFPINADMMQKIMGVMGKMNREDYRTRLIRDLKPLLSAERKQRADDAIKFLQIMEVLPLLRGIF